MIANGLCELAIKKNELAGCYIDYCLHCLASYGGGGRWPLALRLNIKQSLLLLHAAAAAAATSTVPQQLLFHTYTSRSHTDREVHTFA